MHWYALSVSKQKVAGRDFNRVLWFADEVYMTGFLGCLTWQGRKTNPQVAVKAAFVVAQEAHSVKFATWDRTKSSFNMFNNNDNTTLHMLQGIQQQLPPIAFPGPLPPITTKTSVKPFTFQDRIYFMWSTLQHPFCPFSSFFRPSSPFFPRKPLLFCCRNIALGSWRWFKSKPNARTVRGCIKDNTAMEPSSSRSKECPFLASSKLIFEGNSSFCLQKGAWPHRYLTWQSQCTATDAAGNSQTVLHVLMALDHAGQGDEQWAGWRTRIDLQDIW